MVELCDVAIKRGSFELCRLNLTIEKGELALLSGRSGSGKSTILETICGLHSIRHGILKLRGVVANNWPLATRAIGWLPQSSVLFQNLTVRQQIVLPLRARRWTRERQQQRLEELSAALDIDGLLDRSPNHLSGGEARRVALARAVAFEPDILCLDEPLVSLDEGTRKVVGRFLASLHQQGMTMLLVTHERGALFDGATSLDVLAARQSYRLEDRILRKEE